MGKPNRLWRCGGSWDSEEHRDIPQSPWSSGGAGSQVSSRSVTQSQRQRGSLGLSLCSVVGQIVGPYHLPPNSSGSQPDRGERARQDTAVRSRRRRPVRGAWHMLWPTLVLKMGSSQVKPEESELSTPQALLWHPVNV